MKKLLFLLIITVPLIACGGTYTITTSDIKEGISSAARGHTTIRERRLVIYNHTDLTLTVNFRGEIIFLTPKHQIIVSYPYTALLADGQSLKIPIIITTDNIHEKGILRTWTVYKNQDTSESWLIQVRDREIVIDLNSTDGWWH